MNTDNPHNITIDDEMTKVEELSRVLAEESAVIEKGLSQNRALAAKYKAAVKASEADRKSHHSDAEIVSGKVEVNISLLHKKIGSASYVKGRCWWRGRQREVQIGSIDSLIERYRSDSRYSQALPSSLKKGLKVQWEEMKANEGIIALAKEIGREKFRAYVIRQLIEERQIALGDHLEKLPSGNVGGDESQLIGVVSGASGDWYTSWRLATQMGGAK